MPPVRQFSGRILQRIQIPHLNHPKYQVFRAQEFLIHLASQAFS